MQRSSSKWILLDAHLGPSTPEGGGPSDGLYSTGKILRGISRE